MSAIKQAIWEARTNVHDSERWFEEEHRPGVTYEDNINQAIDATELELANLKSGVTVPVPASMAHAEALIAVAEAWLRNNAG